MRTVEKERKKSPGRDFPQAAFATILCVAQMWLIVAFDCEIARLELCTW